MVCAKGRNRQSLAIAKIKAIAAKIKGDPQLGTHQRRKAGTSCGIDPTGGYATTKLDKEPRLGGLYIKQIA